MEKTVKSILWCSLITLLVVVIIGVALLYKPGIQLPLGSTVQGNDYYYNTQVATTTNQSIIKASRGTFGSIIVQGTAVGQQIYYDATTTVTALRANIATSALAVLGTVNTGQISGTYTYDTTFNNGLMIIYAGTQGTTTVTYR